MARRPFVMPVAYVGPNARGKRSLIQVHQILRAKIVASQVQARLFGPRQWTPPDDQCVVHPYPSGTIFMWYLYLRVWYHEVRIFVAVILSV
jgi:hypothetical protein